MLSMKSEISCQTVYLSFFIFLHLPLTTEAMGVLAIASDALPNYTEANTGK